MRWPVSVLVTVVRSKSEALGELILAEHGGGARTGEFGTLQQVAYGNLAKRKSLPLTHAGIGAQGA